MRFLILDFYVDEPACFGVPPYISPYIRYIAGALITAGFNEDSINYQTVDEWRSNPNLIENDYQIIFLISGSTVPGKYLGGKIGTVTEIIKLLNQIANKKTLTLIGGPVIYSPKDKLKEIKEAGGFLILGDPEAVAEKISELYLSTPLDQEIKIKRESEKLEIYSRKGSFICQKHPNFPNLIIELETYRGCARDRYCSFCSEAFYGKPVFRSVESILSEVESLYLLGNQYFRLGRQADILAYGCNMGETKNGFPRPVPEALRSLYSGIHKVALQFKILHMDNMNPGQIAAYPSECKEILRIIAEFNSPGDTAAMGIESVDPKVISSNYLKCSPEDAYRAVQLVNEMGNQRVNGIPKLLPGLNFIHGLLDEDKNTFRKNYEFLKMILDEGLLIRRINLRKVHSLEKSVHFKKNNYKNQYLENRFSYYKDKIREEIDKPMLKRIFPAGTRLCEVIIESNANGYSIGRQLGSYPITVKIPDLNGTINSGQKINIIVTGNNERSVTGLPDPLPINRLRDLEWKVIPGIDKDSLGRITKGKKVQSSEEFRSLYPDVYEKVSKVFQTIDYRS